MTDRVGRPTRDETRHWLPSQGVDPAPLTELNAECLGLLVIRAAESPAATPAPLLLRSLRSQWADLPAHAVRRLAAAPFCLFDASIAQAPRWLEVRARGVHEQAQRVELPYFDAVVALSITRRMLAYGWHLARSRPRAACLVLGVGGSAVEALAACSLTALEAAAERNAEHLRPRWVQHPSFWRALLSASALGADTRLRDLMLGGIQRLAAETLTVRPP